MLQAVSDLLWKLLALILSRRPIADWIIARAQRTPYFHLPHYMHRWWLFNAYPYGDDVPAADRNRQKRFPLLPSVRVHHILREDRAEHMHDHPWHARTIILRGWYVEERLERNVETAFECVRRSTRRTRGATARIAFGEFHHIAEVSPGGVHSLFFTFAYGGSWGFKVRGRKVPWRDYLREHPEREA